MVGPNPDNRRQVDQEPNTTQSVLVELRQLSERSTKVKIKDIKVSDHELKGIIRAILTGGELPPTVQLLSFSPGSRKLLFLYKGKQYSIIGGGINQPLENISDKNKRELVYALPDHLRLLESFRTVIKAENGSLTYFKEVIGSDPKGGISPETSRVILATMEERRQELPDFPHAVPTIAGIFTIEVEGKRSQVLIFESVKNQTFGDALFNLSIQSGEASREQIKRIKLSAYDLFSILSHLHQIGQIHGDLTRRSTGRPANWGITDSGEAVLTDWWHTQVEHPEQLTSDQRIELCQQEVALVLFGIINEIFQSKALEISQKSLLITEVILHAVTGYIGRECESSQQAEIRSQVDKLFTLPSDKFFTASWMGGVVYEDNNLEERGRMAALLNELAAQNDSIKTLVEKVVNLLAFS